MYRRIVAWMTEITIFAVSGALAFLLRFDFALGPLELAQLSRALPIWIAIKSIAFWVLHLDRSSWRYVSVRDVFRIGVGNVTGSVASAMIILLAVPHGFPRSVYLLDLVLCLHFTAGVRIITRLQEAVLHRRSGRQLRKVLLHGAGKAGVTLLQELWANPRLDLQVCGFTDDDPKKAGMFIEGVPVLGSAHDLPALVPKHCIEQVLIAIPSASGPQMAEILRHCHAARVSCKTIPGLAEIVRGPGLAGQIRDVAVEDLLGRRPIELDESAIRGKLEGKVVAVTGAAGSIGSELCRQVAAFHPKAIVGYEISETGLFYLEQEMRERFPEAPFYPEIGSIQNMRRVAEMFERHRPSVLYHAAAYKHVPMMESHLFEAVENNVLGTWNVALAAAFYQATDFVMISSDKAVRPTSIMGLTKRVSELAIHSLQEGSTKFVSVRFGNVLGSNGSVVPVFKKQISAGGPVKVTHPEMRRYFMTIPEAVQLVLQASTMGRGGEIFVLDMGEPVKILDLAVNLILLSGLRPGEDIKIEFTDPRPGEKLYEELCTLNENARLTYHEKIRIYETNGAPSSFVKARLELLRAACADREGRRLLLELKELVPEYNPSSHILRQLLGEDGSNGAAARGRPFQAPWLEPAANRRQASAGNATA